MSSNPSLLHTAFNVPKVATDISEVHGIFTYDIPNKKFRIAEKIGAVISHYEFTSSALYASAQSSELSIRSGSTLSDITVVYTRMHPKLHPNRGKTFSNSMFVNSWSVKGAEIETGLFDLDSTTLTIDNGMTFLYTFEKITCKCYSNSSVTYEEDLTDALLEAFGLNPEKGHLLDLAAQWRGVGDIRYFLSDLATRAPKNAAIFKALNALDNLSVSNPALHAGYIARNNGGVAHARSGCLDISTESFDENQGEQITFLNNAELNVAAGGTVLYALRIPLEFNGIKLTRDNRLIYVEVSSSARADFKIWRITGYTRLTKGASVPLVDGDWTSRTDGSANIFIDNSIAGLITGFDKTGLTALRGGRVSANENEPVNFDFKSAPFFLTHNDVLIVEGYGNNNSMGCTVIVGEEM